MHPSASRLSSADRERVIAVAKDINADILPNGLKSEVGVVRDIVVPCSSGNIACRVYHSAQSASLGTVLLIHGGAWIAGSIDFHDNMARLLCSISQAHVVSIEYSCAPDAMYPTQLEEIRSVIRWLSSAAPSAGVQPRPLAVCGDSAGGNMAAVIARESPANSIALVALINPIVDLTLAHLKVPEVRVFAEMMVSAYLPKDADASDPGLSPLLGAVPASHPPAFIAIGDSDPWRVEQELYAGKLQRAGVKLEVFRAATSHLGPNAPAATPLAIPTLTAAALAIRAALGG
jgi:acetyl esterase